jgi:hypothetical protein
MFSVVLLCKVSDSGNAFDVPQKVAWLLLEFRWNVLGWWFYVSFLSVISEESVGALSSLQR